MQWYGMHMHMHVRIYIYAYTFTYIHMTSYVYVYVYMYIIQYVSQSRFSLYELSSCPRTYALTLLEDFQALRVAGRATVASTAISVLGRSAKWQQALLVTEEEIQPVDVTLGRAIGGLMWRVSTLRLGGDIAMIHP